GVLSRPKRSHATLIACLRETFMNGLALKMNRWKKNRVIGLSICITIICSALCLPVAHMNSQDSRPDYKNPNLPVDRRVADLLSRMTLEEKVAQLVCLWERRPQVKPQNETN